MGTVIFNIDFVDKLSMDYKANNLVVKYNVLCIIVEGYLDVVLK